jgi:hypothetical protein
MLLEERRRGKRFQIGWPIKVEGTDTGGKSFKGAGVLRNLSSGGALLLLSNPVREGVRVDLYIKLPVKKQSWIRYSCSVVRVKRDTYTCVAAVRFDTARPEFGVV